MLALGLRRGGEGAASASVARTSGATRSMLTGRVGAESWESALDEKEGEQEAKGGL